MKINNAIKCLALAMFMGHFSTALSAQAAQAAATQAITIEDIWKTYVFRTAGAGGFNFMNDGQHYTALGENKINKIDFLSDKTVGTFYESKRPFDDYTLSADEKKILLSTESKSIYRRSSEAKYWVYTGTSEVALHEKAPQNNPQFNGAGTQVAFTSENNLFVKDLASSKLLQITTDGAKNSIINGLCDWVYEEEFSFTRAFEWSEDGKRLAFLRFDESAVPEFTMQNYSPKAAYPTNVSFKYPKVGEKNAVVSVWIADVVSDGKMAKKTTLRRVADLGDFEYVPRLKWSPEGKLIVFTLNRLQNDLRLLEVNAQNGKVERTLLRETRPTYVDLELNDDLTFLEDGSFFKSSEQSGFNHIYLYDKSGKLIRALTKGDWDVRKTFGFDKKRREVVFQASKNNPMSKEVYAAKIDGSGERLITAQAAKGGIAQTEFSKTFDYYLEDYSTINKASTFTVYKNDGSLVRRVEDNAKVAEQQKKYGAVPVEFFKFTTSEGVELNGWMMKPANFNDQQKHPVFMTQYSGPGSQEVVDEWMGANYWWYQMLTQKGYIVACIDPRGTGGRGEAFKKMTYKQLGHYETLDQIEAARWLGKQPFVDAARIGIFGWSYGGYMSSLCILKGNDAFKAAIAVAPVTNWKWYDSIYTERYMQTSKENAKGYEDNSPVNFADRLKGNYLLIHGMSDDNVHFQNAVEMADALIKNNKQFDTYFYPNKNHGIYGGNTRLHLYTKMTDFIVSKL
jgi:dipeptidyl-peptidase 4